MDRQGLPERLAGGPEKFINTLSRMPGLRREKRQTVDGLIEPHAAICDLARCPIRELVGESGHCGSQFASVWNHDLGRRGWSRRSHICDEIGDCDICLVSHSAHDGYIGTEDGPCHDLLVEGPQVFKGAATSGHDDHINGWVQV